MAQSNGWISVYSASLQTGISRTRLNRLIAVGELAALSIAGRKVIRVEELEQLVARDPVPQETAVSA